MSQTRKMRNLLLTIGCFVLLLVAFSKGGQAFGKEPAKPVLPSADCFAAASEAYGQAYATMEVRDLVSRADVFKSLGQTDSAIATTWTFYQPDSANQGYSFDYFVKKMDDGSVVASMLDSKLMARVEGRTLYLNEDGCNVEVVDMAGNILIQVKNSGNEVNLSGLSNGVYIMKVKKGTDSVVLKTVVK